MRTLTTAALAVSLFQCADAFARQRLNAVFVSDRVLVDLPVKDGGKLRFYTDTGGGGTLLYPAAVERLRLRTAPISGPAASGFPPSFKSLLDAPPLQGATLPGPIYVAPDFIAAMGGPAEADGFLGNNWFAGRIWTWDYTARTFTLEDANWQPNRSASVVGITFKRSTTDSPAPMFPRIVVKLAGEPTSMLLDTGAETLLTPTAVSQIGGGSPLRATSMIAASRFSAWRSAHPEWPVIEAAQVGTRARMIRVPDVVIAGIQVGPVWFTERPDQNFHGMMSSGTDAQVEGALGGNALSQLRVTVDYIGSRAAFEKR